MASRKNRFGAGNGENISQAIRQHTDNLYREAQVHNTAAANDAAYGVKTRTVSSKNSGASKPTAWQAFLGAVKPQENAAENAFGAPRAAQNRAETPSAWDKFMSYLNRTPGGEEGVVYHLDAAGRPVYKTNADGTVSTDVYRKGNEAGERLKNFAEATAKGGASGYLNTAGYLLDEDESGHDAAADAFSAASVPNLRTGKNEAVQPMVQTPEAVRRAKETASDWLYEKADQYSEDAAAATERAKEGLGKVGQTLVDIGIAGTQMLGDVGLNALLPGAGLASMGARSFGSATQEARQTGADMQQQFNYGVTRAAAEVLSEKLFDAAKLFGGGGADDVVERLVSKLAKTDKGRTVTRMLLSGVGEGAEEAVTDLVEPAIKGAFYDKEAMLASYGTPEGRRELAAQAAYDALIGGVLGVAGGGIGIAKGVDAQKNAALREQEAAGKQAEVRTAYDRAKTENAIRQKYGALTDESVRALADMVERGVSDYTLDVAARNMQRQNGAYADGVQSITAQSAQKHAVGAAERGFTDGEAQTSGLTGAPADGIVEPTNGNVERARALLADGATPSQVFNETGLIVMADGSMQDGFDGPVVWRANDGSSGISDSTADRRAERRGDRAGASAQDGRGNRGVGGLDYSGGRAAGQRTGWADLGGEQQRTATELIIRAANASENGETAMIRAALGGDDAFAKRFYELYQQGDAAAEQWGNFFPNVNALIAELDSALSGGERSLPPGTGAASRGFAESPYAQWQNDAENLHNPGENAARNVSLPTENLQGQRTMKGGQTVMESANTPEYRAEQIADLYLEGRMSFDPKTNPALAEEARRTVEKDGWRKALTDWTADVRAGKVSDKLTAMGATLLNNAGNAFDVSTQEYMDIVCDYVQLTSAAGHALQASRILKTLTPESRLYAMQRSIYSIAEEAGIDDAQINPELAENYRNATNDTERDAVVGEIQQDIANRMGSTLMDKFTALRYVNMLGNFKTQIRNVTGNITMALTNKLKNEVAAGIETIAHAVSGGKVERTKSFGVAPELYAAAWNDFRSVQKAALGEGKYSDINELSKNDFLRGIDGKKTIFKNNGTWGTEKSDSAFLRSAFMQTVRKGTDALWKAPEAYRKLTNWAMEQGDVLFSRTTYADALAGYLKAHGVKNAEAIRNGTIDPELLDNARMYAIQEAQEATFRDSNPFSDWLSKAGRRANTPKALRVMGEGTMPFRKTPANVLVRAEEYSPLGAVNSLIKTGQAISKNSDVNANDAINSWAKTLTGTAIFAVGFALAKAGMLRGADDGDDKQAAFDSLTGHQEYALELPDGTSITLDTFAPTVMPLLMGGALYDISAENGWNFKNIESVATSLSDPMINMSMLSGVNDALDNIKFTDNNLGQLAITAALNYLTQGLTNTLVGQAERTFEPNRMTTYVEKDSGMPEFMQRLLGKASAKTPGWDYHQTEYLDAWGRTQSNGSLAERAFNNFLNPTYTSKISDDKVDVELQRLADSTATTKMFPNGSAPYELEFDDKAKNISQQQRETYQKTYGQTAYNNVERLIGSAQYGKMNDGERADAVNYLLQYATTQAKKKVGADGGEAPSWTSKSEGGIPENAAYRAFLDTARAKAVPMSPSTSTETGGAQMQGTMKLNLSDAFKMQVFAQFLGDSALEHVQEAYNRGYSLQQITDFYQAMNLSGADGKSVYKVKDGSLYRWAQQNGFTLAQAQTLYRIFHPSTK